MARALSFSLDIEGSLIRMDLTIYNFAAALINGTIGVHPFYVKEGDRNLATLQHSTVLPGFYSHEGDSKIFFGSQNTDYVSVCVAR